MFLFFMIDITPSRLVTPANNSVDLDTLLSIIGTKDANAIWYDYKLASDIAGNVIVHSQNGVDRPGINVDLEPGNIYSKEQKIIQAQDRGLVEIR
jgi:hypothetical protein